MGAGLGNPFPDLEAVGHADTVAGPAPFEQGGFNCELAILLHVIVESD